MLLGLAQSLARESNFNTSLHPELAPNRCLSPDNWLSVPRVRYGNRRRRIQMLLYIFNSHLTSGTGGTVDIHDDVLDKDLDGAFLQAPQATLSEAPWLNGLPVWGKLVKLARAFNDNLFEPPSMRTQLIKERGHLKSL